MLIKKIILLFLILFSYISLANEQNQAKILTVVADPWCPYNCNPKSNAPGINIELLKMIFEPYQYKIDYQLLEWKRAVAQVREGKFMVLAATYQQDAPKLVYPNLEVYRSSLGFFTQPSNLWKYTGDESISKLKKLLLIDGYSYGEELDKVFAKYKDIVVRNKSSNPLIENINTVIAGDADALIEDINVVNYNLFLINQVNRLELVSKFNPEKIFIGFSPRLKDTNDLIAIYNAEFPKIQQDGRLKKLMRKYGILLEEIKNEVENTEQKVKNLSESIAKPQ